MTKHSNGLHQTSHLWGFLFVGWWVESDMVFRMHIYALFFITIIFSQVYQNGDYVKNLYGNICENDSLEWTSTKKELNNVLFISSFATWWIPCQTESQEIEKIHKEFKNQGVEVIGAGMDWNNPYSCEKWAEKFNLTYPILDDSEGEKVYNYFGNGVVPFNVVIDRNMRLIYSSSGFNKDEIVDAIKTGLKTSIKQELPLKKNKLSLPRRTGYKKLRENKGFDWKYGFIIRINF